jgi:hypothetical protein
MRQEGLVALFPPDNGSLRSFEFTNGPRLVSFGPFVFSACIRRAYLRKHARELAIEIFQALAVRHVSCTSILSAMYDLDAIEAINTEQLVTPLDRILIAGGRPRRRSRPTMDLTAVAEKTLYMRAKRTAPRYTGVLAAAACVTWLSVAVACLLA